jgi:hypothetical protein
MAIAAILRCLAEVFAVTPVGSIATELLRRAM